MKQLIGIGLFLMGLTWQSVGAEWQPDTRLLRAVRQVESGGGVFVYGDAGLSLGDFQIRRGAWSDVSNWRKARGLKVYDYDAFVYHKFINRTYAANYLTILYTQLERQFRRAPNSAELYAAYNMGLTTFAEKCNFDLRRVNAVTARKCDQIQQMVETQMVAANDKSTRLLN